MMEYQNSNKPTISSDEILIIGLGGAGTNILNSVHKYGLQNADTLAISADARALSSSKVKNKIQMGFKFRRGLACGGDPELGLKCVQESETEIRAKITGKKIIFLCVGLGGGSGSGASPLITRIAREENAFVVVFATMPFSFEGSRRRYQADNSMNELAAIASALVTFDNGRMAELVPPTDSVHAAFEASNKLISSSIVSIARIALYPGIVHIGLDDLVSTLSTKRSRCLFGAGSAKGKNRVEKALKMALSSPLIDKGKLLNTSEKVIVHICGGPTTTMAETERFMSGVVENLGISTEIFFGISIDQEMGDEFSATIISSVPEEKVQIPENSEESTDTPIAAISNDSTETPFQEVTLDEPEQEDEPEATSIIEDEIEDEPVSEPVAETEAEEESELEHLPEIEETTDIEIQVEDEEVKAEKPEEIESKDTEPEEPPLEEPIAEAEPSSDETPEEPAIEDAPVDTKPESITEDSAVAEQQKESPVRRRFAHLFAPKANAGTAEVEIEKTPEETTTTEASSAPVSDDLEPLEELSESTQEIETQKKATPKKEKEKTTVSKKEKPPEDDLFFTSSQSELLLDSQPKGRFEGESPNIFEGEDLDIPTFLRTSD